MERDPVKIPMEIEKVQVEVALPFTPSLLLALRCKSSITVKGSK